MDKPHKQLITTYPVAIKSGQSRLYIPNPIPWHAHSEYIQCPKCDTIFIVTSGFPRVELLKTLEKQHESQKEHPDYIASAPEWTREAVCDCRW
jgi:hypothetical protein